MKRSKSQAAANAKPSVSQPDGAKLIVREILEIRDTLTAAIRLERARVDALETRCASLCADVAVLKGQVRSLQMALPRGIGHVPDVAATLPPEFPGIAGAE